MGGVEVEGRRGAGKKDKREASVEQQGWAPFSRKRLKKGAQEAQGAAGFFCRRAMWEGWVLAWAVDMNRKKCWMRVGKQDAGVECKAGNTWSV